MTTLPNLATLRLKSLLMRKRKEAFEENPVESALKPVKDLEFTSETDSDVSEISDVFEDFHRNSYLRPQGKCYLTKHEADMKTMDEFTDNFKKTMLTIRDDLQIGDNLFLENIDQIEKVFNDPKDPKMFARLSISKEITDMVDESTDSIPRPEQSEERKASETSDTSMIWHMLATNWTGKKFEISPPGFDTFKQKQPHWLERPSVSWVDIDHATLKCEKWLDKCEI